MNCGDALQNQNSSTASANSGHQPVREKNLLLDDILIPQGLSTLLGHRHWHIVQVIYFFVLYLMAIARFICSVFFQYLLESSD